VTALGNRVAAALALTGIAAFAASPSGQAASASRASGLYQAAQATAGEKAYNAYCAACHGTQLEGGAGPALSGAALRSLSKNTHLLVGDMFGWIARQMPLNEPASLTHDQYVKIMAYVLKKNAYPAGSKALTYADALTSTVPMTTYIGKQ
jgi:polar amino acid transport system substrate-binding protein